MKKALVFGFCALVLMSTGYAFAIEQPSTVPSGSVTVKAQPAQIMHVPDGDAGDEIVQLNNLRIQGIGVPGASVVGPNDNALIYISAAQEMGVSCQKFSDAKSSLGAFFPCPSAPTNLYSIRVDGDTRLFLRNRTKATTGDFQVGDRINVYGFMDPSTKNVDAIIVRNLDKPVVTQYIQLNNMQVLATPQSGGQATQFVVAQQQTISPCVDFGEREKNGGVFPCPMGYEQKAPVEMTAKDVSGSISGSTSAAKPAVAQMMYPMPRKYVVNIDRATQFIGRERKVISASDVQVGDKVNIYGVYNPSTYEVKAVVFRDLSIPRIASRATVRVVVSQANMECLYPPQATSAASAREASITGLEPEPQPQRIMAPCGIIYNAKVSLSNLSSGKTFTAKTASGFALFENLEMGAYVATAYADGFSPSKQEVKVGNEDVLVSISLSSSEVVAMRIKGSISKEAYVGKEYYGTFTAGPTKGSPILWSILEGALPPGLSLVPSPRPMMPCYMDPTTGASKCPVDTNDSISLSGIPTTTGDYKFVVGAKDGVGNSARETFVIYVRGNDASQPTLGRIFPESGPVGTRVTLFGKNFGANPMVKFSGGAIKPVEMGKSSDGQDSLVFIVPDGLGAYCPPGVYCIQSYQLITPGVYEVGVLSGEGKMSNTMKFLVTGTPVALPTQ